MKIKIRIPKDKINELPDIKKAIALSLCDHDPESLEKALNDEWSREGESPICPAEAAITDLMYEALTNPVKALKTKIFALAGLQDFAEKHPTDPKYAVLYKAIEDDEPRPPMTEQNYADQFIEYYNIELDAKTIDFINAQKIAEVLDKLPAKVYSDGLKITMRKLDTGKYGKYILEENKIEIDESAFEQELFLSPEKKINLGQKVLIHELGHKIDHQGGLSESDIWRKISGWTKDKEKPDTILCHYNLNGIWRVGKWRHGNTASFVSDYAPRNPKEDFCESFTYTVLELNDIFKIKNCQDKADFVKDYALDKNVEMPELVKEPNAMDTKETVEKALAIGYQPMQALPGPKTGKGQPRVGHKYIRRMPDPKRQGKWLYVYEEGKGRKKKTEQPAPERPAAKPEGLVQPITKEDLQPEARHYVLAKEKPAEKPEITAEADIKDRIAEPAEHPIKPKKEKKAKEPKEKKEKKATKYIEKYKDEKTGKWMYVYPWSKPKGYFGDILDDILKNGGLSPYGKGERQTRPEWKEFMHAVPFSYRRKGGPKPDEMAHELGLKGGDKELYEKIEMALKNRKKHIETKSEEIERTEELNQQFEDFQKLIDEGKAEELTPALMNLQVGDKVQVKPGEWDTVKTIDKDGNIELRNGMKYAVYVDQKMPVVGGEKEGIKREKPEEIPF